MSWPALARSSSIFRVRCTASCPAFLVSVPCTHAIPILRSLVAFSPCPLSASLTLRCLLPGPLLAYLACRDVPSHPMERHDAWHGASRPARRGWRLAATRRSGEMLEGAASRRGPSATRSGHGVTRSSVAARPPAQRPTTDDRAAQGPWSRRARDGAACRVGVACVGSDPIELFLPCFSVCMCIFLRKRVDFGLDGCI